MKNKGFTTVRCVLVLSIFSLLAASQIYKALSFIDKLKRVRLLDSILLFHDASRCVVTCDMLYRPSGREENPLDHVIVGGGVPLAAHVNVTFCPSSLITETCGCWTILAASKA